MKILVIHNFHRKNSASGDDLVFKNETELLKKKKNEIITYTVSNDEFDEANIIKKFLMTFGMFWSIKNYNSISKIIKIENPDIIHIHTFFPIISPSVLYAAKNKGKKIIATLHDTRFVCPCATSLRDNHLCNKCGDGKYFRMCKYKCFKQSYLQSFIVACVFKFHRSIKSFYKTIDKYICLNDNQISLLIEAGYEKNKIIKKYNFINDINVVNKMQPNNLPTKYVVFYGRIGHEKGIDTIKKIWDDLDEIPIVIMGGGPLQEDISNWAKNKKNVYYLGYVKHDMCIQVVKNGDFVVFPSIWYEGCSMVEIETKCLGKPIIAYDIGYSSEAIKEGINGYKIPLNDIDLFKKRIQQLWKDEDLIKYMGKESRKDYEKKYTESNNYIQLINIYKETLNQNTNE